MTTTPNSQDKPKHPLLQLAGIFLKIGAINFGGTIAMIGMMDQEFVRKRKWISEEHFLDLVAATNLVPGPNSSEMAAHIGYVRAGYPGLLVSGLSFFIPAVIYSTILGIVYVRYGSLPQIGALFYGMNPVILALILLAVFRLGKETLLKWSQVLIFALALAASYFNVNEILIIFGAGALGLLMHSLPKLRHSSLPMLALVPLLSADFSIETLVEKTSNMVWQLFLYFLKTGSILFGSGMVLFAYIHDDMVQRLGWLTERQLIDAIAVGQMTPGPVTSTSAFIGYLIAGLPGAGAAALGNFLPSFLIVAAVGPLIPRMRKSEPLQAFLRGINAGVIALMLWVSISIAQNAVVDVWTALVALASLAALFLLKVDSIWLVLGGALVGLLRFFLL